MGRGSLALRLVIAVGVGSGLVACQPLYGGKPEKLVQPQKKKAPKEEIVEIQIKDIEDCQADFRGDPKTVRQQTSLSSQIVSEGDSAMGSSDKAPDINARVGLIKDSIDKYRNALIKDPYNAEATLKLALAYDKLYRKGCALAMLKRLNSLTANPKFAVKANPEIDSITDNNAWFKRYRKEALSAAGR